MALRIGGGLQGPGDLRIEGGGGSLLGGSGGGGAAPQWSVGAPHVFAIAGMQRAFENLSDSMDQRAVTDFMIQTQQQLAADYDDPDTGQFNTRKGAAATGMTQEFRERMRAYWDEEAPKHLNERQRAQIAAPMAQLMLGQAQKIAAFEANNQYQDAVQRSELAEYNAINLAASGNFTPEALAPTLGALEDSIDSQGKLKGWSPEYTAMRMGEARGAMIAKGIEAIATKDPYKARGYAHQYSEMLTPVQQNAVQGHLDRAINARAAVGEKAMKAQRDTLEKELYSMAFDGQLTRDHVEAARDALSPTEYSKFLKMTRGETSLPEKSDPEAVIRLHHMAMAGDNLLQTTADDDLRSGRLTIPDYRSVLNEGQQWRSPTLKQADQILKLKTGYSEMNPNPDAGNSYLMSTRDFKDWLDSDAGKRASDDEKIKMAERIGDNYRVAQQETLLTIPAPISLVGPRTQPDIDASIKAARTAHARGDINDAQLAEELIRIKRMADIIERSQGDAKAKSEQRGRR